MTSAIRLAVLAATLPGPASGTPAATEVPVPGVLLNLSARGGRQRMLIVLDTRAVPLPAASSADDPTVGGASLTVVNPRSGEAATLAMPAAWWSRKRRSGLYRFAPPGGAVRVAVLA